MTKESKLRQVCTCCGKAKDEKDYYGSNSPFNIHYGKLHVCKSCIWEHVDGKSTNLELIKTTLRSIDRPFINDLWNSSIDEAERDSRDVFKTYMKNLGLRQNRTLNWDDSSFEGFNSSKSIPSSLKALEEEVDEETIDLNKDDLRFLKSFWGKGYDIDSLIWLQSEYEDWTNRYECDSKGMETLIQEICLTKFDIKNRREGKEKVDQQLKTLQDLLGSSNLKPVQETGANAVEQETFGTLIKKFENEKPIPEPDKKWRDVDKIGKYVKVFFLGHLSRMLGIKNDYENEYWDEMAKYTVEEPVDDEDADDGRD